MYFCPRCSHRKKKLSINFKKLKFKCWICEPKFSGDLEYLIKHYGTYEDLKEFSYITKSISIETVQKLLFPEQKKVKIVNTCSLPDEYQFLFSKSKSKTSIDALNYLHKRGITDEQIFKWKIGICETGDYYNRIIFPSFNDKGYCNFYIAQSYQEDPKYKWLYPKILKSHVIFNELNINWKEDIFITEGIVDAIKIDNNVIPLNGKSIVFDEQYYSALVDKLLIYQPNVYLCLDTDKEKGKYINRSIKVAEILLKFGIKNIYIINPFPYKDFGEIPVNDVKDFFKSAKKIESFFDLLEVQFETERRC